LKAVLAVLAVLAVGAVSCILAVPFVLAERGMVARSKHAV